MLEQRFAVISDIHGEHRMLARVLATCRERDVQRIVLLGDLFDRLDQVERCARELSGWSIAGVLGNHEREALAGASNQAPVNGATATLVDSLGDRLHLAEALFVHDELECQTVEATDIERPRVVFAGHTHYRQAKDDAGPIDLTLGRIHLREDRRYLINPGAVIDGQFAIWDRHESHVLFERV